VRHNFNTDSKNWNANLNLFWSCPPYHMEWLHDHDLVIRSLHVKKNGRLQEKQPNS
jgi:hypothetical protein